MTTFSEVYNWLNREQNSHLSNKSRFSIWQINDAKLPESQKDGMIDALINSTRHGSDECEYTEVLFFAGKTQAERGKLYEARRHLELAISKYSMLNDPFRIAVSRWMLSLVAWQMADNNTAYGQASTAREAFDRIVKARRQELHDNKRILPGLEDRVHWFSDRINQMNDDLIEKPEEAYTWLSKYEESHLPMSAKQLKTAIFQWIANREYHRAYDGLKELQEMVRVGIEPYERGEVLAFSGLIYHQMGNSKEAEKSLRLASSNFPPERHHHTVVRWMQAMVLAQDTRQRSEAIRMCNECVRCFEWLRLDSDHRNRTQECVWYETQAATLRRAVKGLVERM